MGKQPNASYAGREHSWIKHQLLERYLGALLSIIGVAGKTRAITYVDCFAGPWGDPTEDLAGTSIAISLRIIAKVRDDMTQRPGVPPILFKAIFIEKNRDRFQRLETYLAQNAPDGIECHALPGDYVDQQDALLQRCGESFTFFFVDPKGWRDVGIGRLTKLLQREHSEFLINFMYDFINRAVGMAHLREQVEEVLGPISDAEVQALKEGTSEQRSDLVVHRYREALKNVMRRSRSPRPRSYHAEILNPQKERLHYHLVYLTRHPKGVVKFAAASEEADFLQSVVRIRARQEASGTLLLFGLEGEAEQRQAQRFDERDIEADLLARFSSEPIRFNEVLLADILESTGWFIRDIEGALKSLMQRGAIRNLDASKLRPKHPVHFAKGERIIRLIP